MPSPDESAESTGPLGSDSNISRPEFTDSGFSKKPLDLGGLGQKEQQIEFLCPNGHRLHGAASLQGRPGQCPECGSRFRIPTYEDISAEEEAVDNISLGRVDGGGSDARKSEETRPAPSPEPPKLPSHPPSSVEEGAMPTTISSRGASQGMAALVARLWEIRPADAMLELRLRDGSSVVVRQFLKTASQQNRQAVFTMNEANGSVSLGAVAWDAIAQATLRGLKEIPKELAD